MASINNQKNLERRDRQGLASRHGSGAYLGTRLTGKRCAVASKPFNINYIVPDAERAGGIVILNGDQITRIAAQRTYAGWEVIFYTSDGGQYRITPGEWSKTFVKETFGKE